MKPGAVHLSFPQSGQVLQREGVGGEPSYAVKGPGATSMEIAGIAVRRSGIEDLVNTSWVEMPCHVNHNKDYKNVLGSLAALPTITSMPAGTYGRVVADEPFDAVSVEINVSQVSEIAMNVVRMALDPIARIRPSLSVDCEIKDQEMVRTRDGQRMGWAVYHLKAVDWTATTIPADPFCALDVVALQREALMRQGTLTGSAAEDAYRLAHSQDFPNDDDAVMLYQLARLLERNGWRCTAPEEVVST